jgi:hypothetical protein
MTPRRVGVTAVLAIAVGVTLFAVYRADPAEPTSGEERESEAPIVAPPRIREGPHGPVVVLDSAEAARIGMETAVLSSTSATPPLRQPGTVVEEPERSTAVRAPLSGRLTVPEGARWPAMGDRVAAGAEVGRISDARPLTVPLAGVVTAVGARPGEIVAIGQMLLTVVDRTRPAVRVVWDPALGEPPGRLTLEAVGAEQRIIRARLVGPAPEADPLTRRPAYLYRADRAWPGSTPGTPVTALAPSREPPLQGAMVPDRGVVQWDGLAWAYRRTGVDTFERVRVPTDRPVPGGWIVTRDFAPGDTVVLAGAQELLSEEFRARVSVGEESGE